MTRPVHTIESPLSCSTPSTWEGSAVSITAQDEPEHVPGFVANAVCLAIAARSHAILGLAILAWTIGLRHALDADHIRSFDDQFCGFQLIPRLSAIDNATRTLINHGRLAITCGLFFSLGHSTIVIVVVTGDQNIAIVISTSIYNKLGGIGNIGSIVGTAISGSFLFIVGLANSIILYKILRQRRQAKRRTSEHGGTDLELAPNQNMLMMRLLGPLVNFVNRPWKMYPVGVLFGLGFDTASSIALLAISALAKYGTSNTQISPSDVIILPLLFTTGMSLVDSLDSILMLYSYTGFAGHSWRIFESTSFPLRTGDAQPVNAHCEVSCTGERASEVCAATANAAVISPLDQPRDTESKTVDNARRDSDGDAAGPEKKDRTTLVKRSTMSELSIVLTTMSILLAFSISLIEIMGVIGAYCSKCEAAASAPDGGGLAGSWWRFWAQANADYGYIGAGIVGAFVVVVGCWYMATRRAMKL